MLNLLIFNDTSADNGKFNDRANKKLVIATITTVMFVERYIISRILRTIDVTRNTKAVDKRGTINCSLSAKRQPIII